jgi:hypothetical protein
LLQVIDGMEKELLRVAEEIAALNALSPRAASGAASFRTVASMKKTASTLAQSVHEPSTLKTTRKTAARTMKNTSTFSEVDKSSNVDPNLVKQWTRLLGILYYGCDLPQTYQQVPPPFLSLSLSLLTSLSPSLRNSSVLWTQQKHRNSATITWTWRCATSAIASLIASI